MDVVSSETIIELRNIAYDIRARDGTWCCLPYPGHPKGCPNFPECPKKYPKFGDLVYLGHFRWVAVIEEFDLGLHSMSMRFLHPNWTDRQCRNLLYWQGGVRKRLREKARSFMATGDIILQIPEAWGINVFETMAGVGITIDRHPEIVRKVMLVGKSLGAKDVGV